MELREHQEQALRDTRDAMLAGDRRICVVAPTGSGKTVIFSEMARRAAARNSKVVIYTNRKQILAQASRMLGEQFGVGHGVMAAGYQATRLCPIQVASIQTVHSRAYRGESWDIHDADLVIVDEAHSQKATVARQIMSDHLEAGAFIVGFTATPVGIGDLYDRIVVGGRYSELRREGYLRGCRVYAPEEPDMQGVKMVKGEYNHREMTVRVMECLVFANVFDWWKRLNQYDGRYTIVWAPGVAESKWLAGEFGKHGVAAEHIDGETSQDDRDAIFRDSETGDVEVICSCGVLREGVDLPWIRHGILLQVCGGLSTYMQVAGRLLRPYPGKPDAVLQDHAGAWHRHGPPDMDRDWDLDDTDAKINEQRKKARQSEREREPICCPKCGYVRDYGPKCPNCGHSHKLSVRRVRMKDGTLVEMKGPTVKPKRAKTPKQLWDNEKFAGVHADKTIWQMRGWFKVKYGYYPPDVLLPPDRNTWHRKAADHYPYIAAAINKRRHHDG